MKWALLSILAFSAAVVIHALRRRDNDATGTGSLRGVAGRGAAVVLPELPDEKLIELQQVTRWLSNQQGLDVRPYCTFDFGRARDESGVSIVVPEESAEKTLYQLRNAIDSPLLAFIGTHSWLGDEQHEGVELVVGAGQDQFDILRIARSDAVNYGMVTDDLIQRLGEYNRQYGIDITRAATDVISFRLPAHAG